MSVGGSVNPLRQQMINMMYLVLMALLALNVSADILKAFALVNKGLDKTNFNFEQKNALVMGEFADLMKVDKLSAKKYYNNAVAAKNASDAMFGYIQRTKDAIASRSGGWVEGSGKTAVIDDNNLEVSTRYFLKEGHGKGLKDSLALYKQYMQGLLDSPGDIPVNIDIKDPPAAKDGEKKDWITYYWEGIPSVAAITELTKLQNDIRNAESEVTNYNINKVGKLKFKVDYLEPVISSETPVLSSGQNYQARIFLGAVSKTYSPKILVNGVEQQVTDGAVDFSEPATGAGTKTLNVSISVPDPRHPGHDTTYYTKTEYTVFTGASTISADKMNMMYTGLENPVSVSAPGFTSAQTLVKNSGGGILKQTSPGHYTFKPDGSESEVSFTCFVKTDNGLRQMGQPSKYRIRPVPHPEVLLGVVPGGLISKGEVITADQVNAGLGKDFVYEGIRYRVNSYTIMVRPSTGTPLIETVNGSKLPGIVKDKLKTVRSGDIISVASIACTGPNGNLVLGGTNWTIR